MAYAKKIGYFPKRLCFAQKSSGTARDDLRMRAILRRIHWTPVSRNTRSANAPHNADLRGFQCS